jgi:hypothetical protein
VNVFDKSTSSLGNSSACFFVPSSTLRDGYATIVLKDIARHLLNVAGFATLWSVESYEEARAKKARGPKKSGYY